MPATPTARLKLPLPAETDPADVPADLAKLAGPLDGAAAVFVQGALGTRPAAGLVGRFYWATDTKLLYYDDGTAWTVVGPTAPTALPRSWYFTGDNSGDSTNTNNGVVSFAKMPSFTTVPGQYYRVRANYQISGYNPGGGAVGVYSGLFMGSATLPRQVSIPASLYTAALALEWVFQAPAGNATIAIGHRPVTSGQNSYVVNSAAQIPVMVVEETTPPLPLP